jgi:uncharacterized protein (DUF433 family)
MQAPRDIPDPHDLPVTIDRDIVSGAPVFRNTRVPIDALMNNIKDGMSLDEFLENFPSVSREQAMQVLEFLRRAAQPSDPFEDSAE